MYLKSIALAVLFLQAVNEAHSIKCYVCQGDLSSDCETNPDSKELLVDCTEDKIRSANSLRGESSSISNAISSTRASDDLSCVTLYGTIRGEKRVERYCALKRWSCDELRKQAEAEAGVQVDSCERCGRDGCNAPVPRATEPSAVIGRTTTTATTNETQSALRCYRCSGEFNSECHRYPEQKKFENVCSDMDTLSRHFHTIADFNATSRFHCLTYETMGTPRGVVRGCAPKSFDCEILMDSGMGGSTTNCRTCDVDLCNASSTIQAAMSTLVCCFFAMIALSKQVNFAQL